MKIFYIKTRQIQYLEAALPEMTQLKNFYFLIQKIFDFVFHNNADNFCKTLSLCWIEGISNTDRGGLISKDICNLVQSQTNVLNHSSFTFQPRSSGFVHFSWEFCQIKPPVLPNLKLRNPIDTEIEPHYTSARP